MLYFKTKINSDTEQQETIKTTNSATSKCAKHNIKLHKFPSRFRSHKRKHLSFVKAVFCCCCCCRSNKSSWLFQHTTNCWICRCGWCLCVFSKMSSTQTDSWMGKTLSHVRLFCYNYSIVVHSSDTEWVFWIIASNWKTWFNVPALVSVSHHSFLLNFETLGLFYSVDMRPHTLVCRGRKAIAATSGTYKSTILLNMWSSF